MYRLSLFLFATFAVTKSQSLELNGRIIGGQNADIKNFPYQVYVQTSGGNSCGGSIIKSTVVLTAAHCIFSQFTANDYSIQYGLTRIGGPKNVIKAKQLIVHENFNSATFDNDVALIILVSAIPNAKTIGLATSTPAPGTIAIVSGWGTTDQIRDQSVILQSVNVQIIPKATCQQKYAVDKKQITNGMLCAGASGGGKDACTGDSGGPLVVNGILVGIVSNGHGCGLVDFPGIYSDVAHFRDWIIRKIHIIQYIEKS